MVSNSEMCIESNENVKYSGVVNRNALSRGATVTCGKTDRNSLGWP